MLRTAGRCEVHCQIRPADDFNGRSERCDTAPTPARFTEIVSDGFPVLLY
jgi:hypothetical protein